MIKIIFTRPLTIYNSSQPINSALFSKEKTLRFPRLSLNSFNFDQKRCNTSKGFRALFIYCIWSKNDSFLSVFSKAAFLSFTFFSSDSQLCVVGFLIKQLFYSGLLDMKWSKPTRRFAPSWLYIISYPARPHRIIVQYIYVCVCVC